MCGIMGYIGGRQATPILLDGLRRLEYRGYDSAGIAVIDESRTLLLHKAVGKLGILEAQIKSSPPLGNVGVGHTRWATHGKPSEVNAHPHTDCTGQIVVIHNGIIENYAALKKELLQRGHRFASETDTEVLAHLIEEEVQEHPSLEEAFRRAVLQVRGASAMLALRATEPDKVLAIRLGNAGGLVVGYGDGEMYLASDLLALLSHTHRVVFLASHELAVVTGQTTHYTNLAGEAIKKTPLIMSQDPVSATKGGYKHFMLKEIMEQPETVTNALRGRMSFDPPDIHLADLDFSTDVLKEIQRVVLVGMGTSNHAAMLGRLFFEQLARIPAEAENASEFRYRNPPLDPHTLLISIGQSGETVDTLAAMDEARSRGIPQITICNTEGSQATRVADATLFIRAGQEVGVASTKCLTNSVVSLLLLAAYTGKVRGVLPQEQLASLVAELTRLPATLGDLLERDGDVQNLASEFYTADHFLFLGRGLGYPVALEGALKLKEVSYIHAEGYPAGEMKHGPIALVDKNMPVVAIAPQDEVYDKMVGNVSEVKARDGVVIGIVTEGEETIRGLADFTIDLPPMAALLAPIAALIPLQLLAYHVAAQKGCDVDQPRNLAKSVTVE